MFCGLKPAATRTVVSTRKLRVTTPSDSTNLRSYTKDERVTSRRALRLARSNRGAQGRLPIPTDSNGWRAIDMQPR